MKKKRLNSMLFLILSIVIITILPACKNSPSIEDIEGYWSTHSSSTGGYTVLTITKNTLARDQYKPSPITVTERDSYLILSYSDKSQDSKVTYINIIDKNKIKLVVSDIDAQITDTSFRRTYTRIDEATAKKYIKENEDRFKPISDPF